MCVRRKTVSKPPPEQDLPPGRILPQLEHVVDGFNQLDMILLEKQHCKDGIYPANLTVKREGEAKYISTEDVFKKEQKRWEMPSGNSNKAAITVVGVVEYEDLEYVRNAEVINREGHAHAQEQAANFVNPPPLMQTVLFSPEKISNEVVNLDEAVEAEQKSTKIVSLKEKQEAGTKVPELSDGAKVPMAETQEKVSEDQETQKSIKKKSAEKVEEKERKKESKVQEKEEKPKEKEELAKENGREGSNAKSTERRGSAPGSAERVKEKETGGSKERVKESNVAGKKSESRKKEEKEEDGD